MANFLLKKQNERSFNVYLSRQLVGTINLVDTRWNGTIHSDGVREQVVGFENPQIAFHTLVLALKLTRLHKSGGEFIPLSRQGQGAMADRQEYEARLQQYVRAFNTAHADSGRQLRVVQPRRPRR